jgi:hypothetical protein
MVLSAIAVLLAGPGEAGKPQGRKMAKSAGF